MKKKKRAWLSVATDNCRSKKPNSVNKSYFFQSRVYSTTRSSIVSTNLRNHNYEPQIRPTRITYYFISQCQQVIPPKQPLETFYGSSHLHITAPYSRHQNATHPRPHPTPPSLPAISSSSSVSSPLSRPMLSALASPSPTLPWHKTPL